ncbi:MAG: AAA family ATPase, partial [Sneathiellales bacterium]|nr:AAA family ATPase [Sneathiellales bacterium]
MGNHMFVVTGGPGTGKTSLIQSLSHQGLSYMPEAGRSIIKDQITIGGKALPCSDPALYAEHMLCWDLRSYQEASSGNDITMMDRGLPDIIGYLEFINMPVPTYLTSAVEQFRYNRHVFFAPFWDTIYIKDAERKQTREEAEATG